MKKLKILILFGILLLINSCVTIKTETPVTPSYDYEYYDYGNYAYEYYAY